MQFLPFIITNLNGRQMNARTSMQLILAQLSIRICKHCHEKWSNHYTTDCYKNPTKQAHNKFVTPTTTEPLSSSTALVTNDDITTILKQVLYGPATAMSLTSGNSWYFNYGYCNYMTSDSTIFLSNNHTPHLSSINTAGDDS